MAGLAAVIGAGASLISKFIESRSWALMNLDDGKVVEGQFPAADNSRGTAGNWGTITSLNSGTPILDFLHGTTDRISLKSLFYERDRTDRTPAINVATLISWTRKTQKYGRPPILRLSLGDGRAINATVILGEISSVKYGTPGVDGKIKRVDFTMNFLRFQRFSISEEAVTDTRFHRAKDGESYELIAQREYGLPLLGDLIRKQPEQSGKALLTSGDVVKLPSVRKFQDVVVTQTSEILKGGFGRALTAQKALLEAARLASLANAVAFTYQTPGAPVVALSPGEVDVALLGDLTTEHAPVALFNIPSTGLVDQSAIQSDLSLVAGQEYEIDIRPGSPGRLITDVHRYECGVTPSHRILGDVTVHVVGKLITGSSLADEGFLISCSQNTEVESGNALYGFRIKNRGIGMWSLEWFQEHGVGLDSPYEVDVSAGVTLQQDEVFSIHAVRINSVVQFYSHGRVFGPPSPTLIAPTGGSATVLRVPGFSSPDVGGILSHVKVMPSGLNAAQVKAEHQICIAPAFGRLP